MELRPAQNSSSSAKVSRESPSTALLQEIRGRLSARDFEIWFAETPCQFQAPNRFVFIAPNRFRKAWMEKNHRDLIRDSTRTLFDAEAEVDFVVGEAEGVVGEAEGTQSLNTSAVSSPSQTPQDPTAPHLTPIIETAGASVRDEERALLVDRTADLVDLSTQPFSTPPAAGGRTTARSTKRIPSTRDASWGESSVGDGPKTRARDLNPQFTFEDLVSGPPNRVAHAAAIAVSELPGPSYNPLFVYGDRGLGKTHLLQGICHRLFQQTHLKVSFFTSEAFTSRFVASAGDASLKAFREQWRETDVLVVDDVHFLADKERTQDELFHTLNTLLSSQKQVVLSSVSSPHETTGMQERLLSRFKWGLVTRLERPDFELRVAVLLRKARSFGYELPAEVAEFIAKHVVDNLREVEGALARVVSVASLQRSPICLDIAHLALRELLAEEQTTGTVTVGQILQAVQSYYKIRPKDLLSRSKVRSLVYARQMGMYLARELTPLSLEGIGAHFGGRDHTTVLYALERINAQLPTKPQVRGDLQLLRNRLASLRSV